MLVVTNYVSNALSALCATAVVSDHLIYNTIVNALIFTQHVSGGRKYTTPSPSGVNVVYQLKERTHALLI